MTTEKLLLQQIVQTPDDDTVRLVYADRFDELPSERVRCPRPGCGYDAPVGHVRSNSGRKYQYGEPRNVVCKKCDGLGTVVSTANADRAELIRVQCELARSFGVPADGSPVVTGDRAADARERVLRGRERALFDAHPEWKTCPCPVCGSNRFPGFHGSDSLADAFASETEERRCETCGGSGDLFHEAASGARRASRNPRYVRGFVDSVSCRMREVGGEVPCPECGGDGLVEQHHDPTSGTRCPVCYGAGADFVPTNWAAAVVDNCPVLTRFRINDQRLTGDAPGNRHAFGPYFGYDSLPRAVAVRLTAHPNTRAYGGGLIHFGLAAAGQAALGEVLVTLVREYLVHERTRRLL